MSELMIAEVAHDDVNLHRLIDKLDEDLLQRYPAEEVFVLDFSDPAIKNVVFMVAYSGETAIGCGAIKPLDETFMELKRFYVEPQFRKNGVAGEILQKLEAKAKEKKAAYIRLETGAPQPEAIGFYKKHGYYEIEKYGEYVDCESSLCYEKSLGS
ncbi:GNAT family N-acetyltransferase [Paenibacillus solisilvae]|uniref:GNAT family N-acetyltransferase n=1 Tax=Paenibacillus solisilvae TaxID=2486751 RepID=A0ABW0W5B9_9BACL